MEVGLKINKPFVYLDDICPKVNWEDIHNDTARGLAKAPWVKTAVSADVHPDWADIEMATYYKNTEKYLTDRQRSIFDSLNTMEQKIKFLMMTTRTTHPFWLCFLRVNKTIESTQHENKADSNTCYDTPSMAYFPKLMSLIRKLPMKSIGRILIFMTEANNQTVPHRDAPYGSNAEYRKKLGNADFIWFQPQAYVGQGPVKKIFVMDEDKTKHYPDPTKKFVWFNEMDYHGTDPSPVFSYSVRVEGEFA